MFGMRYESADVTDVARYITDDAWTMEQKVDGIRCLVTTDDNGVARFTSHTGEPLRSGMKHHAAIARVVTSLRGCVLDGELLATGELWLFDVLRVVGTDCRLLAQSDRRRILDSLTAHVDGTVVHILPESSTAAAKTALWADVLATGAEGVVVKRCAAKYKTGKGRTSDILKIKVTRTIDVVVTARNLDGHRNAELGLWNDGVLTVVGRCSMVGKPDAQPGDVVEVTFLNVLDGSNPSLYQPRLMRTRPDRTSESCDYSQLTGCTVSRQVLKGTA